ncbi:MAG TPA: hypothetical protein VGC99_06915 [Candidatus Tectomicrobia bacterium]
MVWALAVAPVISWGSLYYAFSLFLVPRQASLGWSRPLLNGDLPLGLLSTGALALPVGAWIDRHGGRTVMTFGFLVGGLLLLAWAQVETPWAFYLTWALIGASLARCCTSPPSPFLRPPSSWTPDPPLPPSFSWVGLPAPSLYR